MNECYESLLNRRSVRKYKAEMPPKAADAEKTWPSGGGKKTGRRAS